MRQKIDDNIAPESRRQILVSLCMMLFVLASFQAYDNVNDKLKTEIARYNRQMRDDTKLYQDSNAVAVVNDPTIDVSRQVVLFPIVTADRELDMTKGFEFRDWKLICSGQPNGLMAFGAFRQISYPNMQCRVVGTR